MVKPPIERFWERAMPVPECGCWLWIGRYDKDGYGYINVNKKRLKAHRFSYEQFVSPIPGKMSVLHKCDMPECVNPEHLFLGTQKENMCDMTIKNRRVRGEKIGNSKLKEADVFEILSALDHGESQYAIASRYGINQSHVSDIKNGKRWSYIQRKSLE
jgi:HNH endonuclease